MYVVSVVEQTLAKMSDVIDSFSTSPQTTRCSFVCSEFEWRRMMTSLVYWLLSQKSIIKTGKGTHFICFTMLLFHDYTAPRKRKKKTLFELEALPPSRSSSSWFSSSSSYLISLLADAYRVLRVVYFLVLLFLVFADMWFLASHHSWVPRVMVLRCSCGLKQIGKYHYETRHQMSQAFILCILFHFIKYYKKSGN